MIEEKVIPEVHSREFISTTIIRWMDKCDKPEPIDNLLKFAAYRLGETSDEYVNIFLLAETKKALPAFKPSQDLDSLWADNGR